MDFIALVFKIIFWGIFWVALVLTILTYFLFWFELRINALTTGQPLQISWFAGFKSLFIEFCFIFITILLFPFRAFRLYPKPKILNTEALPILLVHGYLAHQNVWAWFIHQLQKKEGVGPIYSVNFTLFSSIPAAAESLKGKIQEILQQTGKKQVILVGHSMGGLVCSYYSEYFAEPDEIARVIALGTPFQGSRLCALVMGENATEMSPDSSFLSQLLKRIEHSSIPYYLIASKMDNKIIPWEAALILDEPAHNTLILENHGHLELLISRQTIEQVSKWITQ